MNRTLIGVVVVLGCSFLNGSCSNANPAEELCEIFEAGYLQPDTMDVLLERKESLFSRSTMRLVQQKKQELGARSEAHRAQCYSLPEERQTDCLAQNPGALMAMWLHSLEEAVAGEAWYNTPYGRWDINQARRFGTSLRPSGQMKVICNVALGS